MSPDLVQTTTCFCGANHDSIFEGMLLCEECQTCRQPVMPDDYETFYQSGYYHTQYQRSIGKLAISDSERMEHDLEVSRMRYSQIISSIGNVFKGKKVLDVGCGNGSFVLALKQREIDIQGVEKTSECLWNEIIDDVLLGGVDSFHLPYRSIDVVTMFDVLEHLDNPIKYLKHIHNILKRRNDGILIIEGPVFGIDKFEVNDKNKHHIRPKEHIWNLSVRGYGTILARAGFKTFKVEFPMPGRVRIYASDDGQMIQLRIGLPAGIGDVHWVMLKMESIKKANDPCEITFCVNEHTPPRVAPFLEMLKYTHEARYQTWLSNPHLEADIKWDCRGVDFGIVLNNSLEHGKRIETLLPEYEVDWDYPVFFPPDSLQDAENLHRDFNPLVVLYLCSLATNNLWASSDWNIKNWLEVINAIYDATKQKLVLVGSSYKNFKDDWRDDSSVYKELKKLDPNIDDKIFNLIGETEVPEVLAIIKEADLVVGMPSGLTIMSAHFRRPTVTIWPAKDISKSTENWSPDFPFCWVDPKLLSSGLWRAFYFGAVEPNDVIQSCLLFLLDKNLDRVEDMISEQILGQEELPQ